MKSPTLELTTLGDFRISFCGEDLMSHLSGKALALLCYLSLSKNQAAGRDLLAGLFWNEEETESARYNLRFTMWKIKKFFRETYSLPDIFYADKKTVKLYPDIEVKADFLEVKKLYERSQAAADPVPVYEAIRELYQGDFLENYEFKNCHKLNDWIFEEKEDLQYVYFKALEALAEYYLGRSAFKKAIDIYRGLLKTNPFMEDLHVALIRVFLAMGDRSGAFNQYERCVTILRDELNVAPMESTRKVYDEIVRGRPQAGGAEAGSGTAAAGPPAETMRVIRYESREALFKARETLEPASGTLFTDCGPTGGLAYYWLWNLLEELLDTAEEARLRGIAAYYWKDVMVYNSRVGELLAAEECQSPSHPADVIRGFSSLASILKTAFPDGGLHIFIDGFDRMDKESSDFYRFLTARPKKIGLTLHLCDT